MRHTLCIVVALEALSTICSAQTLTETFGSGANAFSMEFVTIGNTNNEWNTRYNGKVAYIYNLGKYEVSRDMVLKAVTAGGFGLTLADMTGRNGHGNGANRPATGISWNEAARFVNWLNTSKGYQAAYNFPTSGPNDNIAMWNIDRSSQLGTGWQGDVNRYRHKDAVYFLPSVDEWVKGAYYDPNKAGGAGYWEYPTMSDTAPNEVSGGTTAGTAVFNNKNGPADIFDAGGLSAYGTMAQGGNVYEWVETAEDGVNDLTGPTSSGEFRGLFGGDYYDEGWKMEIMTNSTWGGSLDPGAENFSGFRVAMIPEPSSLSLLVLGGVVVALRRRR